MAKTRTYLVNVSVPTQSGGMTSVAHCVEAMSKAAAENHVRGKYVKSEVASGTEVAAFIKGGGNVEVAGLDPQTENLPGVAPQ